MTGATVQNSGDAIWDDSEWISWDYINQQIEGFGPGGGMVEDLIAIAKAYFDETGRHLAIYGELGEHYAARRFGIELHQDDKAEGSDGRLGNSLVEVKTISPLRSSRQVKVKKAGNFGYLAIVRINADFRIDAKLISRKKLGKPQGDHFIVTWDDHVSEHYDLEL